MIRKIYFLLLVLFLGINVHAQEAAKGLLSEKLRLGLHVDPLFSFARAPGVETKNKGIRFGIQGGLSVDYYFAKNYGFATGLNFNYQGARLEYNVEDTASSSRFQHTYKTQFLELPLGLKFRTNEIGYLTYFLELGIVPSVLLSARADYTPDWDGTEKKQEKANDRVTPFNLMVHIGGGVEYNLSGQTSLIIGAYYNHGLLNMVKDSKLGTAKAVGLSDDKVNFSYVALRLGVLF